MDTTPTQPYSTPSLEMQLKAVIESIRTRTLAMSWKHLDNLYLKRWDALWKDGRMAIQLCLMPEMLPRSYHVSSNGQLYPHSPTLIPTKNWPRVDGLEVWQNASYTGI